MTARTRRALVLAATAGFAAFLVWGLVRLPAFGHGIGVVGRRVARVGVLERHATDLVTAVNFDYRAMDTVGEEFIVFTAVVGVSVLLRQLRAERTAPPADSTAHGQAVPPSEAVRLAAVAMVGPTVLIGIWILAHGHLTPGGGFQGGVVLGAAPLLLYLGDRFVAMRRASPLEMNEVAEAVGAGGFVVIGLAGLVATGTFLENFLPLGKAGMLDSSGTMPLVSLTIGLEVAGALVVLATAFLEQSLVLRGGGGPR